MRRLAPLVLALLLSASAASAQEWREALKRAAATAADRLTDGQLTRRALVGSWNYTEPGVKFESDDLASELGGAAIESAVATRLAKAYGAAGIAPGACAVAFGDDETFTLTAGKRTLSGTYAFDPATHTVALHVAKGKYDLGTIEGHAYLGGDKLQIVFPVTRLVDMVAALGSKLSSLASVAKLMEKYDDVYAGFAFSRE